MMKNNPLPPHIRQLVDKNNFVIAIKTLAQEQNISLEQAKALIDAYEDNQKALPKQGFDALTQDLNTHLQQENLKLPLIPYWVKRVMVILLVIGLLGWLMWRAFGSYMA